MHSKKVPIVIDRKGFRLNVGMVIFNHRGQVLLGRRINNPHAWQFPQGGIQAGENPKITMYRELYEELGLEPADVEYVTHTKHWLYYYLPPRFIRHDSQPLCIGQKQKWFLLRFVGNDNKVRLEQSNEPEFDAWEWVNYWDPIKKIVTFKRSVYCSMLKQFSPFVQARMPHEDP